MKHNKIFSSEVVHKGKTLDRVLESSDSGDIEVIDYTVTSSDAQRTSSNNQVDSFTGLDNLGISVDQAAKMLKAIYEKKSIIFNIIGSNMTVIGPRYTTGKALVSYGISDNSDFHAPYPILWIYIQFPVLGFNANMSWSTVITSNSITEHQQQALDLAGLTVEDFYRKFFPDNPYFPAE